MSIRVMSTAALILSVASVGGMSAANAADLGGGCCSDLEERVAELEATSARKGNRKVSVEVYGQVNTALMHFDNGEVRDTYVVDNQTSNSRFGLRGSAKISSNLSAGFQIEVAVGLGAESSTVTEANDDGTAPGDSNVQLRQANWYLSHKALGKVTVGRLSMATDGISEIDLGGINVVAQSGLYFGNDIAVGGLGGANFDFFATGNYEFDRNNAVRYDTPTVGGFFASAAWGENDRWDVALRYAGELGGFKVAGGIGYGVGSDNSDAAATALAIAGFQEAKVLAGSLSVMHVSTGLFVTAAAAKRDVDATADVEQTYWALRGGIAKNWFGIGNTVLYGEYNRWQSDQDLAANALFAGSLASTGNEATAWGFGIVQNLDAAAMELYLAYKNHSVELDGAASAHNTDDTHLVIGGARVKF